MLPRATTVSSDSCTVTEMNFSAPSLPQSQPSDGWRMVSFLTWIGVLAAVLAVTISSRTIGRSIWWLGPSSNPAPVFYLLIPIIIIGTPLLSWVVSWGEHLVNAEMRKNELFIIS